MTKIESFQKLFQDYLDQNKWDQAPATLYEPVGYLMRLGGKRLRPLLTLLAYSLFAKDVKKVLPAAMAVEVFHNFSLVHDDIMDQAPLRRGHASVHSKYGLNTGILSGDVMLIYAYEYLLMNKEPEIIKRMVSIFNKVAIKVCEGQQYDMNFEKRSDVTIEEYIEMISCKTAALIAGSLSLGATAASASQSDIHHLEAFGNYIGIAFQLQDDYLDTFGDPDKVGKKPGGDIIQNKKTFLILKALELADFSQQKQLEYYLSSTDFDEQEKVQLVVRILQELHIPKLCLEMKKAYQDRAFDHLQQVSGQSESKALLEQLSLKLVGREY